MSNVPLWIQILQALLTPAIALAVGVIAYRQWRLSHTKILLDLFDRRLAAYNALIDALRPAHRDGTIKNLEDFIRLRHAVDGAHFLFGDDVRALLKELVKIGAIMNTAASVTRDRAPPNYQEWVDKNHNALLRLLEITNELPVLMEEYVTFSDKRIPTFGRRLKERNRIRLSYADEKQR